MGPLRIISSVSYHRLACPQPVGNSQHCVPFVGPLIRVTGQSLAQRVNRSLRRGLVESRSPPQVRSNLVPGSSGTHPIEEQSMVKRSPLAMAVLCFLLYGCGQAETPVDGGGGSDSQAGSTTAEDVAAAQSGPGAEGHAGHDHAGGPPHGPGGPGGGFGGPGGPGGGPGGPGGGRGGRGGGPGQSGGFNPESIFERQDANGDGKVDLAEYTEALKNSPWGRNVEDP